MTMEKKLKKLEKYVSESDQDSVTYFQRFFNFLNAFDISYVFDI